MFIALAVSTAIIGASKATIKNLRCKVCGRMCRIMCEVMIMATNLAIDQQLLDEAQKIGGKKTKKDTVNEALVEYVQRRKQKKIVALFGQVEYEPDYDYKREREAR